MPAPSTLIVFALSTLAILVVPGPSVMFVVARTLEHGRSAGLAGSRRQGAPVPPGGARRPAQPEDGPFFLAFLPGFVDTARGPVATQVAVLGACFVALATLTDGAYAVTAARLSRKVRSRAGGGRRLARASAGTYGLLGVLALAGGA